ncbi:MAG: hypothetical protein JW953_10180, partial [Anaerolineae bacterium]|nr:hypothetical protein [Anaerolineae bacterium]
VEGEGEVEPETPPWLAEWPEAEQAEPLSPEAASEEELEMPDWLSGIQETPVEEKGEMEPDTPPWLAEWPEAEQVESAPTEPAAEVEPETPAWLTELPEAPDTGLLSSLPEPKSATKAEPEMPDWLSDLPKAPDTGTLSLRQHDTPAPLSEAEESPGGEFSTEPAAEEELELPAWLSELPEVEAEHPPAAPVTPATGGEREMPEWLSEVEETPAEPSLEPIPEEELELPAWLSELPQEVTKEPPAIGQVEAVDEAKTEETGWLSDIKIPSVEQPPAASPAEDTFDLEWLSETTPAGMEQVPAAEIESDTPWLADEDEDEEPPLPPWLAEDEEPETSPPTVSPASSPGKSTDKEEPAWLSALDEPMVSEKQPATPEKAETAEEEADLPAWLFDSPETTSADETGEDMAGKPSSGEDWLAGLREATEAVEAVLPSEESKPATSPPPISPPPTIDKADPHKSDEPKPGGPKASQALPPSSGADSPVRGQAPGWLQALKPAETVEMVLEAEDGQAVESTGVLAGLTGLLPAEKMVTAIPTITPKPANGHADATLQAAQDFYAIATQPPQPAVLPTLPGQLHKRFIINNVIRTGLFILFIILLALPLWPGWSKTTPWTEPPPEVSDVLGDRRRQMISEQLGIIDRQQPGAVALVSFDFSTATQGEMQPLAEAIIGRLRGQGMRVILVSLEPEGAALAQTLLDNRDDAYGVEVINLGYLPGQVVAVRELATGRKQLSTIKDFKEGVSLENRSDWGNVHNLHQIDLLVTLADNPATVKWWVEQMEIVSSLGQDKQFLLAATSATAAPFLQPYRHSGQLDGLIAGINGAAAIEASRQQFGPARQMLDSQSIAHLLIIVLIVAGIVAGWMPRLSSPEPEKQAEETT